MKHILNRYFWKKRPVLPGFGLSFGFTILYLSLIVLIPLSAVFFLTARMGWTGFWASVTDPRALAAYRLSFGASFLAALINLVFGFATAWALVRYEFPGKRLLDGLVDLPFAIPTAVSGIALTAVFGPAGWIGSLVAPLGVKLAFSQTGVLLALIFIGIPFVVRTVEPALRDLDLAQQEAALSLGAGRFQIFRRVILPECLPALLVGLALSFARAVGEYGSVIFIAGNMPFQTEIAPLIIITRLEQYDYQGATAIALVLLVLSFFTLFLINAGQKWAGRRLV